MRYSFEAAKANRQLQADLNDPLQAAYEQGFLATVEVHELPRFEVLSLNPLDLKRLGSFLDHRPMIFGEVAIRGAFVLPNLRRTGVVPYFAFTPIESPSEKTYASRVGRNKAEEEEGLDALAFAAVLARRQIGQV